MEYIIFGMTIEYSREDRRSRVVVSPSTPLPVRDTSGSVDTLLVATTTVTADANRDLLGSTNTELPTLDGCMQYRKLVWFAHRASNTAINYTIRARATDLAGTPLGSGWQTLASGTFAADPANPTGCAWTSPPQATTTTTSTASKSTAPTAATTHSQVNLSGCADDPHHWRLAT